MLQHSSAVCATVIRYYRWGMGLVPYKGRLKEDLLKDRDIVIVNLLLLLSISHNLMRHPSLDGREHGFFLLADLHAAC